MKESDRQIFPALESRPFETWQLGALRLPGWIPGTGGEPYRPWIALCLSLESGRVVPTRPGPEDEIPALLESAVAGAGRKWRSRPAQVQVAEVAWARPLEDLLAPYRILVETRPELPELERVLENLRRHMAEDDPRPGPLTGDGVTLERLAAFARAAADFFAASGWRHLNGEDRVRIEAPDVEAPFRCVFLDHHGGRTPPELSFFPDPEEPLPDSESLSLDAGGDEEHEADGEPWDEEWEDDGSWDDEVWKVEFLKPWEAPPEDADLWEKHGLPWAGDGFIPVAGFWQGEDFHRPDRRQLALFEGLLAALAATVEEDLDTGRWEKRVSTADGPVRFVLTLPDLLEEESEAPPAPFLAWRFLERSLREIRNHLASGESLLELDEDALLSQLKERARAAPETPEERAEILLDRAYETAGRRSVLLARQALAVWPDCADAYNLLAGRAPDPESAGRLFELGLAAGERALGPETFAEAAGDFWGVLETRPYMRARQGLADSLLERERFAEAAEHFQAMLRLNPEDNQGVRQSLVNVLIKLDRDTEAREVLDRYPEDHLALLEYPRALLEYRREGDSPAARKALKRAVQANRFVPGLLLHTREMPPPAAFFSPGREDEAALYLVLSQGTWEGTEGALDWLRKRTAPPVKPRKKSKARRGKKKRR